MIFKYFIKSPTGGSSGRFHQVRAVCAAPRRGASPLRLRTLKAGILPERRRHGVVAGVLQLSREYFLLNQPVSDLQGARDRRLRSGEDVPDAPAVRRRIPQQSGGHHRRGLPRESFGG